MKAKVWARRTQGRIQPWHRQPPPVIGSLVTSVKEAPDERKVIVLSVNGGASDSLVLFEPRLISAGGIELKFTGYECVEFCWVIQEWVCELEHLVYESNASIRDRFGVPTFPLPR